MRFPHCVAIWKYLRWFNYVYVITTKTQRNAENARVNGMWQLGFTLVSRDIDIYGTNVSTSTMWKTHA